MPFPLPLDPTFRKEVVEMWLIDVGDQLSLGRLKEAKDSCQTALEIFLSLPPGWGDPELEEKLVRTKQALEGLGLANPLPFRV